MARAGDRPIGRLTGVLSLLVVSGTLLVTTASGSSAAKSQKDFSAAFTDPPSATVPASLTNTPLEMTFTNDNDEGSTIGIGSIRVSIPAGFADVVVTGLSRDRWHSSATAGSIDLNAVGGQNKLFAKQSLVLDLTTTTPCPPGDYEWLTRAWVATDFTSSQFTIGAQPTLTVSGPSATRLDITSTTDANGQAFAGDVDGHLYVEQGQAFDLVVEANAPVCTDTEVTLTATTVVGNNAVTIDGDTSETIQTGKTTATFTNLSISAQASTGVNVCADDGDGGLTRGCVILDVLQEVVTTPGTSSDFCITAGGVSGGCGTQTVSALSTATADASLDTQCDTDATNYTCVTILVPGGVSGTATAVVTPCSPCSTLEVRFLGTLTGTTRANHATMIIECDKTACKGSPPNFGVDIDPDTVAGDTFGRAPNCPAKDTIGDDQTFCFDPILSHKDGASDMILFVHFIRDIKGRR